MSESLRAPAWSWVLAALYVLLGAVALADDRFLHDEGLLTHTFALLVDRDPWPAVFLQKIRPPIAVLYAPVAAAGVGAFLWAHLLVSALAVPLVAAVARRLGHAAPNVAAAVVALSPMYVAAGTAGLSNADAVVGVALVLWLWSTERELTAGLVLGMLVWVRAELLVLVAVMLVWSAMQRRVRPVIGLAIFPVVYGLAGAAYHAYLPWMFHYPPALSEPMPDNPFWQPHHRAASLADLSGTAVALSPAVVLLAVSRPRSWRPLERWWGLFLLAFAGALVLLPRWQVFNFDQSPRYLLPLLPVLALAAGRATERWHALTRVDTLVLVGVALLGVAAHRTGGALTLCWAALGVSTAAALAGGQRRAGALAGLMVLLAMGPRHFGAGARIGRDTQVAHLAEMVERIEELAADGTRPIITNEPILAAYLARSGGQPDAEVHYLVQADQVHELTSLTNPANGQRERIFAALSEGMYGRPIFPDALRPDAIPSDALFVLSKDPRLALVLTPDPWDDALTAVSRGRRIVVQQLAPPPRAPRQEAPK